MLTLEDDLSIFLFNSSKMQLHISIAILLPVRLITASCYYPDGKLSESLSPCNTDAEESHCCGKSTFCVSHGFCFSSALGSVVRRGCTEPSWNTSVCGGPGITGEYDAPGK